MNVIDTLKARGFIKQVVYEEELYKLMGSESVTFYIGFDPTADSLHVGHFLQLIAMSHLQRAGHRPIILIGGGTAMVGDPSGRSDMRSMMTVETIRSNVARFKEQMSKFLSFEGENAAVMVDNADWLLNLNYVSFLRDIGVNFSVNRMLTAECFKSRLERGLSFLEFNYMLMQAYDFLVLNRNFGCKLQCGGDDQWSNILAGADLIRRKEGREAYAMTFELLTTAQGTKMGKTQKGAVWLDAAKTSPYEFYQYWRNVQDEDVEKCLRLLTFLELSEIAELTKYRDERMNAAKARLAFELTATVHGATEAEKAAREAEAAFSGIAEEMPSAEIEPGVLKVADILVALGLAPSKGEAKRLIAGGGIKINEEKVDAFDAEISGEMIESGFVLHKGKKQHIMVTVKK
ncbi:MAG: tyrosine--tRNA ligase [Christensenellales bacterium]|jgi:tyrosyl-tRNA synthetase|nr:tyrosine--tRNA ligase [Clostridia bacterium]HRU84701.1 tyrosine--tRNA ligase [Eubacteriales bacterium]